jgi:spore maturation protein CgeB
MSISIIISENYLQQVLFEILSLTMSIAIYPFRAVQNCILFFSSFFVIILRLNASSSTQRTFEIPACGGLLLGEKTDFQKSILSENKEAFYFDINNIDDLKNKINFILNNPTISQAVRINGYKKIFQGNFTYECRIRQILDTCTNHSL